jgi:hypothetical protein
LGSRDCCHGNKVGKATKSEQTFTFLEKKPLHGVQLDTIRPEGWNGKKAPFRIVRDYIMTIKTTGTPPPVNRWRPQKRPQGGLSYPLPTPIQKGDTHGPFYLFAYELL